MFLLRSERQCTEWLAEVDDGSRLSQSRVRTSVARGVSPLASLQQEHSQLCLCYYPYPSRADLAIVGRTAAGDSSVPVPSRGRYRRQCRVSEPIRAHSPNSSSILLLRILDLSWLLCCVMSSSLDEDKDLAQRGFRLYKRHIRFGPSEPLNDSSLRFSVQV